MRAASALVATLAIAGCAGGADATAPARPGLSSAFADTVYAVVASGRGAALAALDPITLRARRSRLPLDLPVDAWALSPEGQRLALAVARVSNHGDGPPRIRVVDVDRMRLAGAEVTLRGSRHTEALVWAGSRLLALVDRPDGWRVAVVDPRAGRVVRVTALPGTVLRSEAAGEAIVALLAPRRGIGTVRLAIVDGTGRARSVSLPLAAGWRLQGELRQSLPALAVEPRGRRAAVVSAGDRVVEVDLRTLSVRAHELSRRVSLLGRLRDWLEPPANAKGVAGSERRAVWAGRLLAVTGSDGSARRRRAAPLALIDTRTWTLIRRTDPVGTLAAGAGVVLAYGGGWATDHRSAEVGLTAYGPDGDRLYHLFGRRRVAEVVAAGPYAYVVDFAGTVFGVVDLRRGALHAPPPTAHARILGAAP